MRGRRDTSTLRETLTRQTRACICGPCCRAIPATCLRWLQHDNAARHWPMAGQAPYSRLPAINETAERLRRPYLSRGGLDNSRQHSTQCLEGCRIVSPSARERAQGKATLSLSTVVMVVPSNELFFNCRTTGQR